MSRELFTIEMKLAETWETREFIDIIEQFGYEVKRATDDADHHYGIFSDEETHDEAGDAAELFAEKAEVAGEKRYSPLVADIDEVKQRVDSFFAKVYYDIPEGTKWVKGWTFPMSFPGTDIPAMVVFWESQDGVYRREIVKTIDVTNIEVRIQGDADE